MNSFQWDRQFETGLCDVDDQHRYLVDLINRFGELLTESSGILFDDIERVFAELASYADYHFQEEEAMMVGIELDPRYIDYHKELHKEFIDEVAVMHRSLSPEKTEDAERLLRFLIHWLAYHILGIDKAMAAQIANIEAGMTPEQAYAENLKRIADGAVDPLLKALNGVLHIVSERNRELTELNRTLEERVAQRTQELAAANRYLEEIALTDQLTGLPNRRHAMLRFAREWEDASPDGAPLACLLIDADGFKQINDTYGHDAGDEVLRVLARRLRHSLRTDDFIARMGGDEFMAVLPRTPLEGALQVAEAMRRSVDALRVQAGAGEWKGSVSIGAAARSPAMLRQEELIKAADDGVYVAKRQGRNRVATAEDEGA